MSQWKCSLLFLDLWKNVLWLHSWVFSTSNHLNLHLWAKEPYAVKAELIFHENSSNYTQSLSLWLDPCVSRDIKFRLLRLTSKPRSLTVSYCDCFSFEVHKSLKAASNIEPHLTVVLTQRTNKPLWFYRLCVSVPSPFVLSQPPNDCWPSRDTSLHIYMIFHFISSARPIYYRLTDVGKMPRQEILLCRVSPEHFGFNCRSLADLVVEFSGVFSNQELSSEVNYSLTGVVCQGDVCEGPIILVHLSLHVPLVRLQPGFLLDSLAPVALSPRHQNFLLPHYLLLHELQFFFLSRVWSSAL